RTTGGQHLRTAHDDAVRALLGDTGLDQVAFPRVGGRRPGDLRRNDGVRDVEVFADHPAVVRRHVRREVVVAVRTERVGVRGEGAEERAHVVRAAADPAVRVLGPPGDGRTQ